MDNAQRMETMKINALRKFLESGERGQADRRSSCIVDNDCVASRVCTFWTFTTDVATIVICERHHRVHPCFLRISPGGPYCNRCNHEGVCAVTGFWGLSRFDAVPREETVTVRLSDANILQDYALAHGIVTRLTKVEGGHCGPTCRTWWQHPNKIDWVCAFHHHIHHCENVCPFIASADDNGNSDTNVCPVSHRTGRNAPVFTSSKRIIRRQRAARGGAAEVSYTPTIEWIRACVDAVMRDTAKNRRLAWADLIWELLHRSGLMSDEQAKFDARRAFTTVIGILTGAPNDAIVIRQHTILPCIPHLANHVPGKNLSQLKETVVSLRTSLFSSKGQRVTVAASMDTPRNVTVSITTLYKALSALSDDELIAIKTTIGAYFEEPA